MHECVGEGAMLASLPGLPHFQFLITCTASEEVRRRRPGNEARLGSRVLVIVATYHSKVASHRPGD